MFKDKEKIKNLDTESEKIDYPETTELKAELKEGGQVSSEEISHEKIRDQIESSDLDATLKIQAQSDASNLQSLETKQKLEKLLQTAQEKGVIFAVTVAKKMNDPYILDTFHDALVREGYYKKFLK